MRDYYTVDEVAYLYGVSKELVFKWIRSGELEAEIIPDAMEEERYFSGRKMDATYYGYDIHPKTLDNFKPNVSYRGVQLLNAKTKKTRKDDYLDYSDKREKDLYDEIEFISKMKSYLRDIEPYI